MRFFFRVQAADRGYKCTTWFGTPAQRRVLSTYVLYTVCLADDSTYIYIYIRNRDRNSLQRWCYNHTSLCRYTTVVIRKQRIVYTARTTADPTMKV